MYVGRPLHQKAWEHCLDRVEYIIRKHMNDGWNSVEKYGLPKDEGVYDLTIINGLEEYVSVRWQFLSGTHLSGTQHYVDGVHYWADNYRGDPINEFLSERVIAWRKKPEPYRPEKEHKMNQGIRYILRTCLHCKKKKIRVKQVYNTHISDWEDVEPWICEDCWKGARENERD